MIRYHEPTNSTKVDEIAASLEANGWQGAPLVAMGDELLTGAHRHAAYVDVFGTDYDLPTIDLSDVFAEAGLDLDAAILEEDCNGVDDAAIVFVLDRLPVDVRDAYGIDVH